MTPQRRIEIERLSRAASRARQKVILMAQMAIPNDPQADEDQKVAYDIAQAEAFEAENKKKQAIRDMRYEE